MIIYQQYLHVIKFVSQTLLHYVHIKLSYIGIISYHEMLLRGFHIHEPFHIVAGAVVGLSGRKVQLKRAPDLGVWLVSWCQGWFLEVPSDSSWHCSWWNYDVKRQTMEKQSIKYVDLKTYCNGYKHQRTVSGSLTQHSTYFLKLSSWEHEVLNRFEGEYEDLRFALKLDSWPFSSVGSERKTV